MAFLKRGGSRHKIRQREAVSRQKNRDKRTDEEQLRVLDDRLGVGIGAVRERARLSDRIKKSSKKKKKKKK